MSDELQDNIIKQLDHLLIGASDDDMDLITKVQVAVRTWDGQGALPFAHQLLAWKITGLPILIEPVSDEPAQPSGEQAAVASTAQPLTLDERQVQAILDSLAAMVQKAALEDDSDHLDRLRNIRKTLTEWRKAGMPAPLPEDETLVEMGLLPIEPSTATPTEPEVQARPLALITERQAQDLIRALSSQLQEAALSDDSNRLKSLRQAWRRIDDWHKAGIDSAPLPEQDFLTQCGLWPPQENSAAPAKPGPSRPSSDAPSAADRVPPADAGPDPDDELQPQFDQAKLLAEQNQYYRAVQAYVVLTKLARGRLVQPIKTELANAKVELGKQTNAAVQAAREAADQSAQDASSQLKAWEAVRTINPDSEEMLVALKSLREQGSRQQFKAEIDQLVESGQQARQALDLARLNEVLGTAKTLAARAQDDEQLREYLGVARQREQDIAILRKEAREVLGVAATKVVEGDLREAYRLALDYIDRDIRTIIDTAGVVGQREEEVETRLFLAKVSGDYLASLRTKSSERLAQAQSEKHQAPAQAENTLKKAIDWLTDEVLTLDHRAQLLESKKTLDRELQDVEQRIMRFNRARDLVISSLSDVPSAAERLKFLISAREDYAEYPRLAEHIRDAQDDRGAELASDIAAAQSKAADQASHDDYAGALSMLADARGEATKVIPNPRDGTRLQNALNQLAAEERNLVAASKSFEATRKAVENADKAIGRYDASDKKDLGALKEAREHLKSLDARQAGHILVSEVQAKLTARQGDQDNWEDGQRQYNLRSWRLAQISLDKIGKDFNEYAMTQQLARRAQAAQDATEAELAETERNWKKAVDLYTTASSLWYGSTGNPGVGTDALTEPIAQRCQQALERLRPIEENDRVFRQILNLARDKLIRAREQTRNRRRPRDKVDPIREFEEAIKDLEDALNSPSTIAAEIQTLLSTARDEWREAYLAGIEAAKGSQDRIMLEKAVQQAHTLRDRGLLYEQKEKADAWQIEAEFLDLEYEFLSNLGSRKTELPDTDWAAVEQNRQQRLQIEQQRRQLLKGKAIPPGADPETIRREMQDAIRKRINAEVSRLVAGAPRATANLAARPRDIKESHREAQRYLAGQLSGAMFIRSDHELIARLIELYWKTADWKEAEIAASRFADDTLSEQGQEMTDVWKGLTLVARALSEDQINRANARLNQLRTDQVAYEMLIAQHVADLFKENLERLLSEAEHAADEKPIGNGDEAYLKAAEKYALAFAIRKDDQRVADGLKALGTRLQPGITARCDQANRLRIGQRPINDVCDEADQLYATLSSISSVAVPLGLDQATKEKVNQALKALEPRKKKWQAVRAELEKASIELNDAIRSPRPLGADSTGGWQFDMAKQHLTEANQQAGTDADLQKHLQDQVEELDRLQRAGQQLTDLAVKLTGAVRAQDFDAVVSSATDVKELWTSERQRETRWDGLQHLLRYNYANRTVDTPQEHSDMASKQRADLASWQRWADNAQASYKEAQLISTELSVPIDDLVQNMALRTIIAKCETASKAGRSFLALNGQRPRSIPLSQKAQTKADQITEDMVKSITDEQGLLARMAEMQAIAQNRLESFGEKNGPLWQLRTVMSDRVFTGSTVPAQRLRLARELLRRCQAIDPLNESLNEFRIKLQAVK